MEGKHSEPKQRRGMPGLHWKAVMPGENDLATLFPDIAAQWDAERNGSLRPDQVTSFSNRKVWWLCPEGHVWRTAISNRTNAKKRTGCPVCAGNVSQKHRHLSFSPQTESERRRA